MTESNVPKEIPSVPPGQKKTIDTLKIVNALIIAAIIALVTFVIKIGMDVSKVESVVTTKEEFSKEITDLKVQLAKLEGQLKNNSSIVAGIDSASYDAQAELKNIIVEVQNQYVKQNTGTEAYQCFTDVDLLKLKNSNILLDIKDDLKNRGDFIRIAEATKKMSKSDWVDLKNRGLKTYTASGPFEKGLQTSAGSEAHKLIAKAIIEALENAKKY